MKEMKKKLKTMLTHSQNFPLKEEFQEMSNEDKEMYLFMRGGFAAK